MQDLAHAIQNRAAGRTCDQPSETWAHHCTHSAINATCYSRRPLRSGVSMDAAMSSLDVTPGTWELLNRLLEQANDLPEPEREAWIARFAPEHAVHADRLRALL